MDAKTTFRNFNFNDIMLYVQQALRAHISNNRQIPEKIKERVMQQIESGMNNVKIRSQLLNNDNIVTTRYDIDNMRRDAKKAKGFSNDLIGLVKILIKNGTFLLRL